MPGTMEFEDNFKEINWKQREQDDDDLLQKILNETQQTGDGLKLDGPLDVGEKADDAQDYEDISDDDLPEEEEASGGIDGDVPGLTDDMGTSHNTDDLFGDDGDDDLFGDADHHDDAQPRVNGALTFPSILQSPEEPQVDLRELNFPEHFEASNQDPLIPAALESEEDLIRQLWPTFEKGVSPNWNQLLPPKKAHYIPKVPSKPPKVLNLSKVGLELAVDQEKSFRGVVSSAATFDVKRRQAEAEAKGLVPIFEDAAGDESSDDGFDYAPLDPDEEIAGTTMAMISIICADFESKLDAKPPPAETVEEPDEPMDDWDREFLGESIKPKKRANPEIDYINAPRYDVPNFDNFEQMTAHIAKKVVLDLNDPHLLVDVQEYNPAAKRRRLGPGGSFKRTGNGSLASTLQQRFNFSNDEAYDALKENHQSKVRATIGNLSVEHSMPALKLQWPYYRVKLYARDARAFHRPALKFNKFMNQPIYFSRPGTRKRKEVKKLNSVQEVFKESKDLSLSEVQASATLLEYSEEHPTVLSNFGMGNRIINYYRRKDAEDTERPQPEDKVGDVQILLPEDKSPFANFGMVDPGETVRTIHNGMYRAPIFKHEPKHTDFLVIRNSTGIGGSSWHIRNIDNLFAVGQQFPSVEIPGPHSRKVTNAAKNRMKMIAFRKIKHSEHNVLKIGDITAHIAESSDMQNRQKLKEFIHYDKANKVWQMKKDEIVPDEATIRSMVKPEEVCVIDAMQVGSRFLEDAGYAAQDDDDEIDEGEGRSVEQDLAPWKTSKAFLEASADKAMLQLHGEGDPSGCGLAFSFIKTSMKGGYIGAVEGGAQTSASQVEKWKKQNGGHTYNVKKQQILYNEAIRNIWDKQKANLSDPTEHSESELEKALGEEDARHRNAAPTPRSNPIFDDNASQFSTGSRQGKVMRIIRTVRRENGELEQIPEIVKDVRVWREYQKRRQLLSAESVDVYSAKPTGNPEIDRQEAQRVKAELARLERNKDRRHVREKQKGVFSGSVDRDLGAASPSATPAPSVEKPTGTTRKCANCGQAGHIKTNKKYCLNCL